MSLGPSGCDEHSERSRFSKSVALERNQPTKAAPVPVRDTAEDVFFGCTWVFLWVQEGLRPNYWQWRQNLWGGHGR